MPLPLVGMAVGGAGAASGAATTGAGMAMNKAQTAQSAAQTVDDINTGNENALMSRAMDVNKAKLALMKKGGEQLSAGI